MSHFLIWRDSIVSDSPYENLDRHAHARKHTRTDCFLRTLCVPLGSCPETPGLPIRQQAAHPPAIHPYLCGVFGVPRPLGILISSPPYSCPMGKRNNREALERGQFSAGGTEAARAVPEKGSLTLRDMGTHGLGQGFSGAVRVTHACACCTRVHKHTPPHPHPANTHQHRDQRACAHAHTQDPGPAARPSRLHPHRPASGPRLLWGMFPLHVSPSCRVAPNPERLGEIPLELTPRILGLHSILRIWDSVL